MSAIKFLKPLQSYDYILSFDLAKINTGWSLIDFKNKKLVLSGKISSECTNTDCIWYNFLCNMHKIFDEVRLISTKVLVVKEALPIQAGKFTTIKTLQALAQTHAIFDLAVYQEGLDYYDEVGVYAISEKAVFSKLTEIEKPTKKDILNELKKIYSGCDELEDLDISDSIAVTHTLISAKWNSDIQTEIKELNKKNKTLVLEKKKQEIEQKISFLNTLKI